MNEQEIVDLVTEEVGSSKSDANKMLNSILSVIKNQLAKGEKVELHNFGMFEITERAARSGRNPKTDEVLEIPASKTVKFTPAKAVKDAVNA
ncbi:HU family DNA-binding protein [Streptomyces sp. NPDC020472]|uniref:HU family DNA-binding protein n=1 Tax=unclassified Streptomyces TaxID=2593676 RepID=UPI0036E67A00